MDIVWILLAIVLVFVFVKCCTSQNVPKPTRPANPEQVSKRWDGWGNLSNEKRRYYQGTTTDDIIMMTQLMKFWDMQNNRRAMNMPVNEYKPFSGGISTYKLFKIRHLVNPEEIPNNLVGWNALMNERGLSDRDQNTFIVGSDKDIKYIFTVPSGNKIYTSHGPLRVVHLKRNILGAGYEITYKGRAFVQASVDDKQRPVHFQYHKRVY